MSRFVVFALLLAACHGDATPATNSPSEKPAVTTITISGSTAMVPLTTEAAIRYMKTHPNVVIEVSAGGSKVGLSQVTAGAVTIGASDVAAELDQARLLEDHRVAVVGFGVVSGHGDWEQPIKSLTHDQVREIFVGNVKDWARVGGQSQPIVVINRKLSSGTRAVFGQIMLGGDHFAFEGLEAESSKAVQDLLLARQGAISYLGLDYNRPELRVFAIDSVEPSVTNIENGHYPLWAFEHLYTRRSPDEATRKFLDWVVSEEFQGQLPRLGFIPVSKMRPADRDARK